MNLIAISLKNFHGENPEGLSWIVSPFTQSGREEVSQIGGASGQICAQMSRFWYRHINQMTHHQVDQIVVDRPLFREERYHALNGKGAVQRADLGAYRA